MNVECKSETRVENEFLLVEDVRAWLSELPSGATLDQITRDFGSQRDPDVRLVGLRARWSMTK